MFKFLKIIVRPIKNSNLYGRCYSDTKVFFEKHVPVPTFCNVSIICPYNIEVMPLDVFENPDRLTVKLISNNQPKQKIRMQIKQHENNIVVFNNDKADTDDIVCCIEAPVKASIEVKTGNNSVKVGSFDNNHLVVDTLKGNIQVSKYLSKRIYLKSNEGNIFCEKLTQAADIKLQTILGNITTERLQGTKFFAETESGNVQVKSCYCNESLFKTSRGNIRLNNVHQSCAVSIEKSGNLQIIGLDGSLKALVNTGDVKLLLSRLSNDSYVAIRNNGIVNMKLMEDCLKDTKFLLASPNFTLGTNIHNKLNTSTNENIHILEPANETEKQNCIVDCKNGSVNIETADFIEMMNIIVEK